MLERGSLINDMWAPFALPIAADIDTRTQWFNEVLLVIGYDHAMLEKMRKVVLVCVLF